MFLKNQSKKGKIIIAFLILVFIAGLVCLIKLKTPQKAVPVACTEEAKLCPDGSYVGRTGPDCAFTACPSIGTIDTRKTFNDTATGISFKYPEKLSTEYIRAENWPPQISLEANQFSCTESGLEITPAGRTVKRMVDSRNYCVTASAEGAAGSTYTQYAYAWAQAEKTVTLTFTLRSVQCDNYDDPQKTACKAERESFDLDGVIDGMAQTVDFNAPSAN